MSVNRIQKLLFSEYCDFEDMVIVESPFAETTRDGRGLRQVYLGLTATKLVLATDMFSIEKIEGQAQPFSYESCIDPAIDTFELIAVYPIECVSLSIFHRRKRQSLKARFCNNKVLYFELGGFEKRNMFWNLWCEKVKFLNPYAYSSAHSETSAASSTSNSTLYLVSSKRYINKAGNSQLWCKYASGDFVRASPSKWTDKYLYLGKEFAESPLDYKPVKQPIKISDFVSNKPCECLSSDECQPCFTASICGNAQINRFSFGVTENCSTALFLPVNADASCATNNTLDYIPLPYTIIAMAEGAVRLWEYYNRAKSQLTVHGKYRRRYAFSSQPHFFHGLGPWNVNKGERFSLQMKRAVSVVNIKRQPIEPELRLTVSKRQLVASISCDALYANDKLINLSNNTIRIPPKRPVIFFWTPEYWYRPRSARDAYQELQKHLQKIRRCRQIRDTFRHKFNIRMCKRYQLAESSSEDFEESKKQPKNRTLSQTRHLSILGQTSREPTPQYRETSLQALKRVLRLELALTAWDFDSNTLALQLTLIDKELFLKIAPEELGVLIWQQSSKNAPNIGAMIAFSHRISCLVATEILRDGSEKIRARLVARFINTADKCNKIANFHSCKSLLCGLQSPPIYRLYSMWTYLRKRHSTKYHLFEKLCRLYRDPRLLAYQHAFAQASQSAPYLPFIGDLIGHLLDRIPDYDTRSESLLGIKVSVKTKSEHPGNNNKKENSLIKKFLSTIRVWQTDKNAHYTSNETLIIKSFQDHFKTATCMKPKPLYCYEEHREHCFEKGLLMLEKYQKAAANYMFTTNELAREYLLKARYREDKENFLYSFNINSTVE